VRVIEGDGVCVGVGVEVAVFALEDDDVRDEDDVPEFVTVGVYVDDGVVPNESDAV